jgi:bifunctional oligoribonuclease and PAP phosphatase NrnA
VNREGPGSNPAAGAGYSRDATPASRPISSPPPAPFMLEILDQETYAPAPHRLEAIDALVEALTGAERVVLTTHLNADGDGVGSEVAILEFLAHRGVEARIVNPTPFPDLFRFLLPGVEGVPGGEEGAEGPHPLVLEASTPEASAWCRKADLVLVLDTGEIPRIGRVKPMVEHLPHRVVDHHPAGDRPIEGPAYRDVDASATGELVFDLVHRAGGPWTRPLVEGLYTAILTDTGSFRFSNATPRAHRVAAELIARGASPDDLHTRVYGMAPLRRYRLLEAALPSLDRTPDGRISWMTVPADAYRRLGCDPADLEGLTDYPRTLVGTEVALLFRAVDDGIKISFRSNGTVDVNRVARALGGGGHVRASGALVQGDLEKVRHRVVELVRSAVAGEGG